MTTDPESPTSEHLVRTLWQYLWIDRDFDALVDLLADPYVRHSRDGDRTTSPSEYVVGAAAMLETIRGTSIDFDQISTVDDQVWVRITLHGVNMVDMSEMTITWLSEYRIAEGRIAEVWAMHQTDLDWA